MRAMVRTSVAIGLLLAGRRALAFDRAACFDAATEGQSLRDGHRLIEARERFRVCAQDECPVSMKGDCATWLADVEKSLPTVVVSVRNETGTDLTDIVVLIDGRPFISMLDGKSMPIDPGPHTFRFARAGGDWIERQVVAVEGEKDMRISTVFPAPVERAETVRRSTAGPNPRLTLAWALTGAGGAAVATGAVAGLTAVVNRNAAHCDADRRCDAGPLSAARTAAAVADVGFVAGGVLAAAGAALFLLPTRHASRESAWTVLPLSPVGGGLGLGAQTSW
jgi:hypothetical protein